jgi:hypothetical protein
MQRVGTREQVMHGTAKQTSGGRTKKDFKYNDAGEIVSRKLSKLAKHSEWNECTERARKELTKEGVLTKGELVLMNKGTAGTAWYKRAMEHYSK